MRSGFAGGVTTEAYNQSIEHLDVSQRAAALSAAPNLVVRASAGTGKALKNGTKVLTGCGWKAIETLTLNDQVMGSDGALHRLIGIYPQGKKQVYRVVFSDGNIIECSPDHL